jgi:cytochrome P450
MALISSGSIILLILVGFAISHIRSFIRNRRFRAFAQTHGAEEAPHAPPNKLPWGIYLLYRVLSAERKGEDLFDDILVPRFKVIGYNTYGGTGLLGEESLFTIDARNIQAILATNFKDWAMGPRRQRQFGVVMGDGIFTSDGADWAHYRGLVRPLFTRENINDLDATEKAYQDLKTVIMIDADDWTKPIDLAPMFYHFTLDTATKFLFGQSVNSQLAAAGVEQEDGAGDATSQAAKDDFAEAFAISQNFMGMRIRLQSLYWLADSFKYRRAVTHIRAFANHYVKLALESHRTSKPVKYTLLEALSRETQNPSDLRNHVLGFLVAGRDTTASLLSWLFLLLAHNPSVFTKLRTAIETSFGPGTEKPDFTTLKSCRYLQYVMFETLRLYPVVAINNRVALRDTVLPTGGGPSGKKPLAVRKGQLCNFLIYGLQRRVDVWGTDAAEFRPERWEGRKMDWNYIPFSGGPRACLGQQYALTEAGYVVVRILQEFEAVEWCGRPGPPRKAFSVTMSPKDGVVVRFRRAKGQ